MTSIAFSPSGMQKPKTPKNAPCGRWANGPVYPLLNQFMIAQTRSAINKKIGSKAQPFALKNSFSFDKLVNRRQKSTALADIILKKRTPTSHPLPLAYVLYACENVDNFEWPISLRMLFILIISRWYLLTGQIVLHNLNCTGLGMWCRIITYSTGKK